METLNKLEDWITAPFKRDIPPSHLALWIALVLLIGAGAYFTLLDVEEA